MRGSEKKHNPIALFTQRIKKASIPKGVENHGGFLRISFQYQGMRVRESLGIPDTAKNRRSAGELRANIVYEIKTGAFNYQKAFQPRN